MCKTNVGGQAVIEGVMMRSPKKTAIAIRKPNNEISVYEEPTTSLAKRHKFLRLPLVRGVLSLVESLTLGFKSLSLSADLSMEEEGEELTKKDMILAFASAGVLAVFLFVIIPTVLRRSPSKN
ncbi:MAG TPA: DUF1385 domain-containing protein, partial [Thermoanaerobacterales bacterium]|nr:DUF1385 domain-containing protein [Thermoanaerobacterales bacterium]